MEFIQEKNDCNDVCETKENISCNNEGCCDQECEQPKQHCSTYCDCCMYRPTKVRLEKLCVVEKKSNYAPEPGRMLLKCTCGSTGPLPALAAGGMFGHNDAIDIASVSIDTRNLCNPTILINVSTIIALGATAGTTLTLSVFKCCNGCEEKVGKSYTFSELVAINSFDSFNFQICDSSNCCDCISYKLAITNATLAGLGVSVTADMSVLAVENLC